MTRWTPSEAGLPRANWRQLLGCLLLVVFAYGATVEAAHRHGPVEPDHKRVAVMSDDGGGTSHTSRSHQGECTTCQFQQQLFNGLVQAPLFEPKPTAQTALVSTLAILHPSPSATPTSDRAPPRMHV